MPVTKEQIEQLAEVEVNNPTLTFGETLDDLIFAEEGQHLDAGLINDLNNHPPMGYAEWVRWLWEKVKEGAKWLWDKLFGDDDE